MRGRFRAVATGNPGHAYRQPDAGWERADGSAEYGYRLDARIARS